MSADVFSIRYVPESTADGEERLRVATEAALGASSGISPKGGPEAAGAVEGALRAEYPRARIWVLRDSNGSVHWTVDAAADDQRRKPVGNQPSRLLEIAAESVAGVVPPLAEVYGVIPRRAWPQRGSTVSGLGARWTVLRVQRVTEVPLHVPHRIDPTEDLVLLLVQRE